MVQLPIINENNECVGYVSGEIVTKYSGDANVDLIDKINEEKDQNKQTIRLTSNMFDIDETAEGYNSKNCMFNEPGFDNVIAFSASNQSIAIKVENNKEYVIKIDSLVVLDKYDNNITKEVVNNRNVGFVSENGCALETGEIINSTNGEIRFDCKGTDYNYPIYVYINAHADKYDAKTLIKFNDIQ